MVSELSVQFYIPQTPAGLFVLFWGVINGKPLKTWILENLLEENPTPQAGCVPVGSLPRPQARLQAGPVLLRESSAGPDAPLYLLQTLVKYDTEKAVTLSFGPEERPGEHILRYVLRLNPCGIFCCCHCFLQNKFWQLKNYSFKSLYRNSAMDVKRLYNFSQGPETWIWIKLNKKYLFFGC